MNALAKVVLSGVLTVALSFGFVPAAALQAFAADGAATSEVAETGAALDAGGVSASDAEGVPSAGDGSSDGSAGAPDTEEGGALASDTPDNEAAVSMGLEAPASDAVAAAQAEPYSVIGGAYIYQVDLEQVEGSTEAIVSLPNVDSLVATGRADSVSVKATMDYDGVVTRSIVVEKPLSEIVANGGSFTMDLMTYGKFAVTATFSKGGTLVQTGDAQTMGIVADEYNIAPVSATLPLTFFSLSLWGDDSIRYNDAGEIVPTIALLERPNAWNWNSLPEGVYGLPYLTEDEIAYQPADFDQASLNFRENTQAMADYVSDLYAMNPDATFNLYVVDFYLGLVQSILYANGIPQDQYTITVMSDGSWSYQAFNNVYSGTDPSAYNEVLKAQWLQARSHAYSTGAVDAGYTLNLPNAALYAAVDAEPNAEWWLARPALLESAGDGGAFSTAVQANPKVVRVYIDRKLSALQAQGDAAVREFKALYNFSDTYFADAEASGKDVMLFLGSTVGSEAGSFSTYARFTMAFYGNEYAYYYKGHPGSPTDFYPEKQEELASLGIEDVDSSIAAELILFFYPDIYLSGYSSSTYASVSDPDMAKGLFRMTKADAMQDASLAVMDWFMSPIGDGTPAAIRALATNSDTYLVEFSDAYLQNVDYTIALWDNVASTIRYYRATGAGYELVGTQSGDASDTPELVTISSAIDSAKVADIPAASHDNGANAQLYANNRSLAQRFQLVENADGSYTIRNVNSGKVLDVAAAGTEPGTNVQQYDANGTDAQKWQLVDAGGGAYSLVSKCNGLYLDVASANAVDGGNLHVWTGNGTDAQRFYLNAVDAVIADGTYTLASTISASMVADVSAASTANAANVQLWSSNSTDAQRFSFVYDAATGCYTIANVNSGKVLDVAGASMATGANVQQYESNGTLAQKWTIEPSVDSRGNACFVVYSSLGTGFCLDVAAAGTADGTNIQVWSPNGTAAQAWYLNAA